MKSRQDKTTPKKQGKRRANRREADSYSAFAVPIISTLGEQRQSQQAGSAGFRMRPAEFQTLQDTLGNQAAQRFIPDRAREPAPETATSEHPVQRQGDKGEAVIPSFTVFVGDERKKKDIKYARRLGKEDAARILQSDKLDTELRQELNAKLRWFEGEAWEVYGEAIKPAIEQVVHRPPEISMLPTFVGDERKRGDKKYGLQVGQEDAARVRKSGKVSGEFREEMNAKLRFFEGEAYDAYSGEIKAAIEQIIPSLDELQDFSRNAINDAWGAQNQGLNDFESELSSSFDWSTFAVNLAGNIIWAAAAYATGTTAFLISLSGIAVSSVGSAASSVNNRPSFHAQARKDIDAMKGTLDGRIDSMTKKARQDALSYGWDGSKTRENLLGQLLKPEYAKLASGGVPVIDTPAIAASVEKELLFRAVTTPWETWAGWKHGNAWLSFDYTIDNVTEGLLKPTPPSQWSAQKPYWIYIFPLGMEELPDLNKRLNTLYDEVLHQPKDTQKWPIRKEVSVLLRGAGKVGIMLGPDNSFQGWSTGIDKRLIEGYLKLAGMEGASREMFPQLLLNFLWPGSSGKPPVIEKLFMGS